MNIGIDITSLIYDRGVSRYTANLINALSKDQNIPPKDAASIVNTILQSMTQSLVNGENVEIRGFGAFSVKHFDARDGRNPKTGENITIKARSLPRFKPGKDLREKLNIKK